jgi:hypothetical protein
VVRLGFGHFADGVRVEHELHREVRFTKSSGIRGGSQSVVNRIESYQDLIFFIEGRLAGWRRAVRRAVRAVALFNERVPSQVNNSCAWLGDSFLTSLMASSTALT